MPCMCGDICCPSCGPAQGNWRCPLCNEWASEGCEHISEETGDLKPEYVTELDRRDKEQDWNRPDDHEFVPDPEAQNLYCAICGASETDHRG